MSTQGEVDRVFREAMLTLTGTHEWDLFTKDLEKEVYHNQASLLDNAQNWDQVVFLKGWNKCLAYIINTRDRTKLEIDEVARVGDHDA